MIIDNINMEEEVEITPGSGSYESCMMPKNIALIEEMQFSSESNEGKRKTAT